MKMKNNNSYESPRLYFTKLETFESVAAVCWGNPMSYSITDPTGGTVVYLKNVPGISVDNNNCSQTNRNAVKKYLEEYGGIDINGDGIIDESEGRFGVFSSKDIEAIYKGTGDIGSNIHTNSYITSL